MPAHPGAGYGNTSLRDAGVRERSPSAGLLLEHHSRSRRAAARISPAPGTLSVVATQTYGAQLSSAPYALSSTAAPVLFISMDWHRLAPGFCVEHDHLCAHPLPASPDSGSQLGRQYPAGAFRRHAHVEHVSLGGFGNLQQRDMDPIYQSDLSPGGYEQYQLQEWRRQQSVQLGLRSIKLDKEPTLSSLS